VVRAYFAEWVEERLQSAGVLGCFDLVDVGGTAACQRPVRAHVAKQDVVAAAIASRAQILLCTRTAQCIQSAESGA